jgi:hypothetical protein
MNLYRIRKEVGGYLQIEVIDQGRRSVVDRFCVAVRAKCAISGGTWAQDEIDSLKPDDVEAIAPGVTIDGEPFWGEG